MVRGSNERYKWSLIPQVGYVAVFHLETALMNQEETGTSRYKVR